MYPRPTTSPIATIAICRIIGLKSPFFRASDISRQSFSVSLVPGSTNSFSFSSILGGDEVVIFVRRFALRREDFLIFGLRTMTASLINPTFKCKFLYQNSAPHRESDKLVQNGLPLSPVRYSPWT